MTSGRYKNILKPKLFQFEDQYKRRVELSQTPKPDLIVILFPFVLLNYVLGRGLNIYSRIDFNNIWHQVQMIRAIVSLSSKNRGPLINSLQVTPVALISFADKMQQKQLKKQEEDFKKQIESMASKPTFTYMDFKQRINDELVKLQSSLSKKMTQDGKEAEKQLIMQKKILSAMYDQELLCNQPVDKYIKEEIAIVTELSLEMIRETLRKADSYRKIHRMLREKAEKGEPLPENWQQVQYEFKNSKYQATASEKRRARGREESKGAGYLRAQREKMASRETD